MESCTYVFVLWILLKAVSGFIMPMTNSGGDPDIASIVNHVTLLEQTMKSQIGTMTTELETAKQDMKTVKSDMRSMQDKINKLENQLQSNQLELASTKTKLQKSTFHIDFLTSGIMQNIASLEENMSYVHSNLSQRIDQTSVDVAFQVSQSATKSGWTKLTFDTVDYNLGGGYNPTSGYFTAPVSGTYTIWMDMLISSSNGDVYIFKNSSPIARGGGYASLDGVSYSTASATVVVHMDVGDTIHFTVNLATCTIFGGKFSQFGGALVHAGSGII